MGPEEGALVENLGLLEGDGVEGEIEGAVVGSDVMGPEEGAVVEKLGLLEGDGVEGEIEGAVDGSDVMGPEEGELLTLGFSEGEDLGAFENGGAPEGSADDRLG